MSKRIEIDMGLNASGIARGAKDGEKALRDLEEAVGDTGKGGARDLDRLENKLKDVQKETKDAGKAGKRAGDDLDDGFNRARGAVSDMGEEAGSTGREMAASFKEPADALDAIQELAANALAPLGPAGLIAGGAAAVGIGLVTAEFTRQQEEADKLRDRITSVYQSAAEAGVNYLGTAALIADAQDVMFNPERAEEYKRLLDTQKQTGIDMSTILMANAGDLESIETVQGRINGLIEAEREARKNSGVGDNYGRDLQTIEDHWRDVGTAASEASSKADDAISYTSDLLLRAADDAGTAAQEVDAFGNKLLTLPSGEQVVIDAVTGKAHQDLDRFKGDVDGVPETVVTTALFDDRQARLDLAAFRSMAQQRLGIPVQLSNTVGPVKWQ